MEITKTVYFDNREDWRQWLEANFDKEKEIWLIYPNVKSSKPRILYNDAVEEALCFGWIDSTIKSYDSEHAAQRYTPRNPKSAYSQLNIERLKWLEQNNMLHPTVEKNVAEIIKKEFVFPKDIIKEIKKDPIVWENFEKLSDSYKRIRIAYIDGARIRQEEYDKRLKHFIEKTRVNKLIGAFGGSEKYYCL